MQIRLAVMLYSV